MLINELAISIKGVSKIVRTQPLLNAINLDVPLGSYLALVGRNGAGKTTLIKALLDFITIDTGSINLFGIPHTEQRSRTHLVFLPEHFLLPYYLTGRGFLSYMAELNGQDYTDTDAQEVLQVLDIDPAALAKPAYTLSKGTAQKLGLAACLLSKRPLLIFDEPMSGLDLKTRKNLRQYLLELKSKGITLFFSTHLLADVESLCDQVAILDQARVCFSGTLPACLARYQARDMEQAYFLSIKEDALYADQT